MCSPALEKERLCQLDFEEDSGRDSASESQVSPATAVPIALPPNFDPMLLQLGSQQLLSLLQLANFSAGVPNPQSFPMHPLCDPTVLQMLNVEKPHSELTIKREPSFNDETTSTTSEQSGITPTKKQALDYAERRRRNNDSARRSREVRRQREMENRHKSEKLARENEELRKEVQRLRAEVAQVTMAVLAMNELKKSQ
ncbi:unnamed protein product, partial [Mesorhabditis spiculigera]